MATSCGHDEAGMRNKVESFLECSVCLEPLKDPRTLPCFHSFCKVCLEKIVRIKRKKSKSKIEDFSCPTCRAVYTLKSGKEVADLPCSHFIRNMLEAVQLQHQAKHANCSKCDKKPASCRCLTCELFLCDGCLTEHNSVRENWPGFKKMSCSVLSIEELTKPENQSKIKSTKISHCSKHEGKKLKFYCETCKVVICRYCMDFDHTRPFHECAPIETAVDKRRESLSISVSALQKKLVRGHEALQALSDVKENLKTNKEKVKELINDDKEKRKAILVRNLEDNAQEKCDKVDEIWNKSEDGIVKQQNEIWSFINEVSESHGLARNILENGTNIDIMESEKVVKESLESVERKESMKITHIKVNDRKIEYAKENIDLKQPQTLLKLGDIKLTGIIIIIHCSCFMCCDPIIVYYLNGKYMHAQL